jgi:hypothetical protein
MAAYISWQMDRQQERATFKLHIRMDRSAPGAPPFNVMNVTARCTTDAYFLRGANTFVESRA